MIDWKKPVRTVKGHFPCEVLRTGIKGRETYPIIIIVDKVDEEELLCVTANGHRWKTDIHPYVENVPETIIRWLNIYKEPDGTYNIGEFHTDKAKAVYARRNIKKLVAFKKIEFEEGEGL